MEQSTDKLTANSGKPRASELTETEMDNTRPSTLWVNGIKPSLGDTAISKIVGRSGRAIHIWDACPDCGTERWIKRNTKGNLCKSCALRKHAVGEGNNRWNGGKRFAKNGIFLTITAEHPFFGMAIKTGSRFQIAEHRLVMAQHLNRCLESWEIVHHKGDKYPVESIENKRDNRIENLQLLPSQTQHHSYTLLQIRITRLETRVLQLEAENILLRFQVGSQGIGNPELSGGSNAP